MAPDAGVVVPGDEQPVVLALRRWAQETPGAPALLAPGAPTRDYGSLAADVQQLAAELAALGIGHADRVAVVMPDGPALATMLLAAMRAATAVPLSWDMTKPEFARALSGPFARAAIVPGDVNGPIRAAALAAEVPIFELRAAPVSWEAAYTLTAEPVGPPVPLGEPRGEDTALVLCSSGTTGRPKRIPRTHAAASITARAMMRAKGVTRDDRLLLLAPLAFSLGVNALLITIAAGSSMAAVPGVSLAALPEWAAALRPTWLSTAPAALLAIAADGAASAAMREARLRMVNAGAAGISPAEIASIEGALCAPLLHSYGMSEAPFIAGERFAASSRKPGSAGLPTHEAAIIGADLAPVEPGVTGEIVTRGPNVFAGYLGDAEASAVAFLPGGWLRTGDVGHVDADGALFVSGRLKEMIKRGGLAISPGEVEAALLTHPAVAEVCAFAVPHPVLGEELVAAVVLRPRAAASERLLRNHLADRLSPAKVPRLIAFTSHIPKGPTGKPLRREMATLVSDFGETDGEPNPRS